MPEKSPQKTTPSLPDDLPENRFFNRELSWLAFNISVLEEAQNAHNPLLERLKFLAISASNLDEFYMVRVASIKNQIRLHVRERSPDGLTPTQQLEEIGAGTRELMRAQHECWKGLKAGLLAEHIAIVPLSGLAGEEQSWIRDYFTRHIFPALTPIIVDGVHPFPFLPNLSLAMVLTLQPEKTQDAEQKIAHAVLPIPVMLDRFIRLPSTRKARHRFALLDDVIALFLKELLPGYGVVDRGIIHIIRDSEIEVAEEVENRVLSFETALERRRRGEVIRLTVGSGMSQMLREFVLRELHIHEKSIARRNEIPGLGDIMELYGVDRPELKFPPHRIRFPERIDDFSGDCFSAIKAKDLIVHHPYESFDVVVQFLRQAARDPNVVAIKQTLYRTSSDSPIVHALIEAAEAGKAVTAVMELKARFDEEANIRWGRNLEKAGAQVIYGVPKLKIHCKVSLVIRNEGGRTQTYVHFGTGNYHPVNARVFSDLSFFTCDAALCRDAARLFNTMTGYATPEKFEKIIVAPLGLRLTLLWLIDEEIAYAKAGRPAAIWLKMNALQDAAMIDALYRASCAGVQIDLVVRGICALRPGIRGLSENIRVKSIVGRFLEHARIFCFGAGKGLPHPESKVFISSADWMQRNLDWRIEVMVPIENPTVHSQVQDQIMGANLKDTKQSWALAPDGSYKHLRSRNKSLLSAHEYFMSNPSLSGRGSALYSGQERKRKEPQILPAARPELPRHIAVMDIGSNSVRLVVYDGLKRVPLPLLNEKVLCGLARDMERTGKLYAPGVDLAYQSVLRYMEIIKALDVKDVFAFATAAVRDAEDGRVFAERIEQASGLTVQVLSGEQEARRGALGIAASFYEADGVVCDLGGGSLELSQLVYEAGRDYKISDMVKQEVSVPLGPLRLQVLAHGDIERGREIVDHYLAKFPLAACMKDKTLYAVGGGFRALAKIHLATAGYPLQVLHQLSVKPSMLKKTIAAIIKSPEMQLSTLPAVSAKRLDTLKFTALVLERLLKTGRPEEVVFSTHGVREGAMFHLLPARIRAQDALIAGAADMIGHLSPEGGRQWTSFGYELYDWMTPLFSHETLYMRRLRKVACILSRLAWHEHSAYRAEMAFRWVLDAELPAIDHWERMFVALIVFYRYQSTENPEIMTLARTMLKNKWVRRAQEIGFAMRLGYSISGGAPQLVSRTRLAVKARKLILDAGDADRALINNEVRRRLEKLATAMGLASTT